MAQIQAIQRSIQSQQEALSWITIEELQDHFINQIRDLKHQMQVIIKNYARVKKNKLN